MKVVINVCFGGFSISPEAALELWKRGVKEIGTPVDKYYTRPDEGGDSILSKSNQLKKWRTYLKDKPEGRHLFLTVFSTDEKHVLHTNPDISRDHPELVKIVEEMGDSANGGCASLKVVEIPDGTDYTIEEYDGNERIAEKHETWR